MYLAVYKCNLIIHFNSRGTYKVQNMANKLTLSYDEFQRLCAEFLQKSRSLGDSWELRETHCRSSVQPQHYLVKKCTRTLMRRAQKSTEEGLGQRSGVEGERRGEEGQNYKEEGQRSREEGQKCTEEGHDETKEEDGDLLDLAGDTSMLSEDLDDASLEKRTDTFVQMEYHVIHSVSFQVPILYFNASYSNGQSLVISDVWELLSPEFVLPESDRWGMVTQQEHPYLGRPFYHIHPCHTAGAMGRAVLCSTGKEGKEEGEGGAGGNYLVTWLSTFGPVVGLTLPLEYAQ